MLLQIDSLAGGANPANWSQGDWCMGVLFVVLLIAVIIFAKKKKASAQIEPEEIVTVIQALSKKVPAIINEEIKQAPRSIVVPAVHKPSVKSKELPTTPPSSSPPVVSTTPIDDIQISKPAPVQVIEIQPVKPMEHKIVGYAPPVMYEQKEQLSYPIIIMPKQGTVISIPQEGRIGRKGFKEEEFKKHLTNHFGKEFQLFDNRIIIIKGRDIPYTPDFTLVSLEDGINMFMDIEIDEPYEGTNDVTTRRAIHYSGADIDRNSLLMDNGWIVVRLAEIQVHQNPLRCCSIIAELISKINTKYAVPISLRTVNKNITVPQWTKKEAEVMSKNKYREKYLGIQNFGVTEEINVVYGVQSSVDVNLIKVATAQEITDRKERPVTLQQVKAPDVLKENVIVKKQESNTIPSKDSTVLVRNTDELYILVDSSLSYNYDGRHDKYGFCDISRKIILECIYTGVSNFSEGLAAVTKVSRYAEHNRYGFIDKTGKEVIPFIYENVRSFQDGLAAVEFNRRWGFIDKTGKQIIQCIYEDVSRKIYSPTMGKFNIRLYFFHEGRCCVCLKDKLGFIDNNALVIPCIYDYATAFRDGIALVGNILESKVVGRTRKDTNVFGVIDTNGKVIIPCKYESIIVYNEGFVVVNSIKQYGFFNSVGVEIVSCKVTSLNVIIELLREEMTINLNVKYKFDASGNPQDHDNTSDEKVIFRMENGKMITNEEYERKKNERNSLPW
jgi:hypothetical protein